MLCSKRSAAERVEAQILQGFLLRRKDILNPVARCEKELYYEKVLVFGFSFHDPGRRSRTGICWVCVFNGAPRCSPLHQNQYNVEIQPGELWALWLPAT